MMEKLFLKELYGELYKALAERKYKRIFDGKDLLAIHVPMVGSDYERSSVRVLWIGRALNGWFKKTPVEAEESFLEDIRQIASEKNRFKWLVENNEEIIDNEKQYNYHHSSFWRTGEKISRALIPSDEINERWFENIAWANLYAASPSNGGNPCDTLCKAQRAVCGKLLKEQIKLLNPTHIVFVTDCHWFKAFNEAKKDEKILLFPDVEISACNNSFVVGYGKIGNAQVLVTVRPEHKIEQDFTDAVVSAFRSMT